MDTGPICVCGNCEAQAYVQEPQYRRDTYNNPTPEDFLTGLAEIVGADAVEQLIKDVDFTSAVSSFQPVTEQSLRQKGITEMQVTPQMAGFSSLMSRLGMQSEQSRALTPAPTLEDHEQPVVKSCGAASTLAEIVQGHILPDFTTRMNAITATNMTEFLREHGRLAARLQKLIKFSRSPQTIDLAAIDDLHELAIYKWYTFNRVLNKHIPLKDAMTHIEFAEKAYTDRQEDKKKSSDLQAKAQLRIKAVEVVENALDDINRLIQNTQATQLATRLHELADEVERTAAGKTIAVDPERAAQAVQGNYGRTKPTEAGGAHITPSLRLHPQHVFPASQARQDMAQASVARAAEALAPTKTEREVQIDYVTSVTDRLNSGEAINLDTMRKASELAFALGGEYVSRMGDAVGKRMFGNTPFIQ